MKKFTKILGVMFIAVILFVGCSSVDSELKPKNEKEEKLLKILKEKYPDVKVVSEDFLNNKFRDKNYGFNFHNEISDNERILSRSFWVEVDDEIRKEYSNKDLNKYERIVIFCLKKKDKTIDCSISLGNTNGGGLVFE